MRKHADALNQRLSALRKTGHEVSLEGAVSDEDLKDIEVGQEEVAPRPSLRGSLFNKVEGTRLGGFATKIARRSMSSLVSGRQSSARRSRAGMQRRQSLMTQLKDTEERTRAGRLRAKMRRAVGKQDAEEEAQLKGASKTVEQKEEQKGTEEDDQGADDAPEEGELNDIIQELRLTIEPAVEELGDPVLIEQRKLGTLNVKLEETIMAFKKHKAVKGKTLFEAENGNNLACEEFHLGSVDNAEVYLQKCLELASIEKKPAAKEMADLRSFLRVVYNGDDTKFYADLSAGEWRSALGRRHFCDSLKRLEYPGSPERLFQMLDSISPDGKIAMNEIQMLLKMKSSKLEVLDFDIMERGIILNNIGSCHLKQGDIMGALQHFREAMAVILAVSTEGLNDHRVQRVIGNITVAYIHLDDYDTALENLSQLQELRERRWGRTHSEVLTVLFHIGYSFLAKASRYSVLHDCFRMDGRAQEKPIEFNYNMALCAFKERLLRQQEILAAKEHQTQQATEDPEKFSAPDPGDVDELRLAIAASQEIVAEIHEKCGYNSKALTYRRLAVQLRQAALADTDPEFLSSCNALAACCLKTGAFDDALAYMERSTNASAMLFGDVSSTVATMLWHTALVLFKLGARQQMNPANALQANYTFELALEKLDDALGMQKELANFEDTVESAATIQLYGSILFAQGERVQARKKMEDALMIRLALLGRTAISTASSAHALGLLYVRIPRRNEEAIQLLRKASLVREKRLGGSSLYLADSLHEQGCALLRRQSGQDADHALTLLSKAAKIRDNRLGKNNSVYAASMHQVGQAHLQLGLFEEARLYLQAALELREKLVGRKTAQAAASHFGLGMAFYHLENYKKAMKHLKASYSIRERLFTMEHPLSADCLHEIGMVYVRKRELAPSIPFLKKSLEVRTRLNGSDAQYIDDDSDEDDKFVVRPESDRQRRIRTNRFKKNIEIDRKNAKKERAEKREEARRLKEEARQSELARKKSEIQVQRDEDREKKKAGPTTRLGKFLSIFKGRKKKKKKTGDTSEDDEDEASLSESEEGSEGPAEKKKAIEDEGDTDDNNGKPMSLSASEDSEIDVAEVGIDVRGWLAGTIGYDMYILSNVYANMKDYGPAKYFLDRAICIQEEVFGSYSLEYAETLHTYGVLHMKKEEHVKSLPYFLKALGIRERSGSHNNVETANTEIQLGENLAVLNQPDEALIHLTRGCSIRDALFGLDDPVTMHLREKWAGLSAGATYYDPVPEGETLPHFARRSAESFLHGYKDKLEAEALKQKQNAAMVAEAEKADDFVVGPGTLHANATESETSSTRERRNSAASGASEGDEFSDAGTETGRSEGSRTSKTSKASKTSSRTSSAGKGEITASGGLAASAQSVSAGSAGLRAFAAPGIDSGVAMSAESGALSASVGSVGLKASGALKASTDSKDTKKKENLRVSMSVDSDATGSAGSAALKASASASASGSAPSS